MSAEVWCETPAEAKRSEAKPDDSQHATTQTSEQVSQLSHTELKSFRRTSVTASRETGTYLFRWAAKCLVHREFGVWTAVLGGGSTLKKKQKNNLELCLRKCSVALSLLLSVCVCVPGTALRLYSSAPRRETGCVTSTRWIPTHTHTQSWDYMAVQCVQQTHKS